jgi:hypothetical protein
MQCVAANDKVQDVSQGQRGNAARTRQEASARFEGEIEL